MPSFGKRSLQELETLDERLQEILIEAIQYFDFTILCGHRNEEDQNKAYNKGRSKLQWPESKHNSYPSIAVDLAPYPLNWENLNRFYYLMGFIRGLAISKGLNLRFGGDWDRDGEITDNNFNDLPHIEIVE